MLNYIRNSHWYYWYTGNKTIAITGMLIASLINGLLFSAIAYFENSYFLQYFGVFGIVLMVLLDHLLMVILIVYTFAYLMFRWLPDWHIHLFQDLGVYLLLGFFINRLATNLSAERIFRYELNKPQ